MKIGLYFGSFNPIHTGHLIIANHVLNETELKKIWFVVSPQNPLKNSFTLLNEYHRLHLVRTVVADDNRFKAIDIEFQLPKPSYTIDTLTYLQEKYPTHQFSVIIGSDSLLNLPKWKNYDLLIKNYNFIIYQRAGFDAVVNKQPNIYTLNAPVLDISSTMIRNLIKEKKSTRYLLPEPVREEIERNGYYLK